MRTEIRYGKRIREARLLRGWTQEHLAEVADTTPRTVARTEKDEVRGPESLMAIAAAFETELRDLATTIRIAEDKPLRSLLIRQPDDLRVAFHRAHHSSSYRTLLPPMPYDYRERAEELLEAILADLQYLSAQESNIVRSWAGSSREPLAELCGIGMEIFTIQDDRECFVGDPENKKLVESWTTGYYLLVLRHSCFSAGECLHRFNEKCAAGVEVLHRWLRQEQDYTELELCTSANVLLVSSVDDKATTYCPVCLPDGPSTASFTDEYVTRITELIPEQLQGEYYESGRAGDPLKRISALP